MLPHTGIIGSLHHILIVCFFIVACGASENLDPTPIASRHLTATCVPQTYPKQGTLLPVSLQSRILDILWPQSSFPSTSEPPKIAFALVSDIDGFAGGPPWRSDNYGHADSWKDLSPSLQAALPSNETMAHVGVVNIHHHPTKPERLLFQGRGRYHWVSEDAGASFKSYSTPGGALGYNQEISPHPNQADWLMAKVRRDDCLNDYRSVRCASDLFFSKDFGASWQNITVSANGKIVSVRDFEWAAKLEKFNGRKTPDEAVFATIYAGDGSSAHKGLYPGWDKDLHYVVTTDMFKSPFESIIPCGNLFEIIANKVFLAVSSECPIGPDGKARKAGSGTIDSRSVTLYVSSERNDGGKGFVEACLPAGIEDDGYNLVHSHDKTAAFVLADHAEPGSFSPISDSPTSDAYAPAYNASLHTLALEGVYRREFVTDFTRIEGLPGVFMANQVDPAAHQDPSSRGREANFVRTRLSLTGGSSWQPLSPPASFRYGQCNTCLPGTTIDQCSLHLHGPTSWFAPEGPHPNFYSQETAPGVLLATGNVGAHLDFSPDADCTYMSRDGGLSWEDIAPNTAIYEMGNHGGIIVIAQHRSEGPTDSVSVSFDQGGCFHTIKLPEAILVENIRIAPGGLSVVFLVHGIACLKTQLHPECSFTGGSLPPGKLFSLDLKELLGDDWKECSLDEKSEDYEKWTVPREGMCLEGAKRTVMRRRRETSCANPIAYKAALKVEEECECKQDGDFECEFGFMRRNATCMPMAGVTTADACPRLSNSGYKTSSTNTRLVHGNICKGVNAVIPDTNGKGGPKGSKQGGDDGGGGAHGSGGGEKLSAVKSFFVFVITCGAIAVAAGLTWTHCLNTQQQERIRDAATPVMGIIGGLFELVLGTVVDVYDWVRFKLRDMGVLGNVGGSGGYGGYEPLGAGGLDYVDPEVVDSREGRPLVSGGLPT